MAPVVGALGQDVEHRYVEDCENGLRTFEEFAQASGWSGLEELVEQPEYVQDSQEEIDTAIALVNSYIETEGESQVPAN